MHIKKALVIVSTWMVISCGYAMEKNGERKEEAAHNVHININTLLHVACEESDFNQVERLLKAGADVNSKQENYQRTALMAVCSYTALVKSQLQNNNNDNLSIMRALIAAKADINATDTHGNTVLMKLMCLTKSTHDNVKLFDMVERIRLLVEAGINVTMINLSGVSALQLAVRNNFESPLLIKALIYAGADLNATYLDTMPLRQYPQAFLRYDRKKMSGDCLLTALKIAEGVSSALRNSMVEAKNIRAEKLEQALLAFDAIKAHVYTSPVAFLIFDYYINTYDGHETGECVLQEFIKNAIKTTKPKNQRTCIVS